MPDDHVMPEAPPAAESARLVSLDELEQLWQRQVGPFLANLKQTALQLIDDLSNRKDGPILARLRQTVTETLETALWAQLKPALNEGGDALRQKADSMLAGIRQMIALTVIEVFRVHVPEYSRWA